MRVALAILAFAAVAPLAAQSGDGLSFLRHRGDAPDDPQLAAYSAPAYRPVRVGEAQAASFLTEHQAMPFGRVLGPVMPPTVRSTQYAEAAMPGMLIAVLPPQGAAYRRGDTIVLAVVMQGPDGWGDIVVPTGLARVGDQNPRQTLATVLTLYGPIRGGQAAFPLAPVSNPGQVDPVKADGPTGTVILGAEPRELQQSGGQMFVSVGRSGGVRIGDFIEIRRRPAPRMNGSDTIDDLMAVGQVVHVGEKSSTIKLTRVIDPLIHPGTPVVRVLTLPG